MKKYLKTFAFMCSIFSSNLIASCLALPCVVGDYIYNEDRFGGLRATTNDNGKLVSSAKIDSSRANLLNDVKKLDEIINRLNNGINLNDIYLLDVITFNDNAKLVLQDLDLPKYLNINASNLILNNVKVNGNNLELGSSYVSSKHIINNLTGDIPILSLAPVKPGIDLTTDINNSNFSISNRFYINNNNLTIKNSEINMKGHNNITTMNSSSINMINSKLFLTMGLTNQGSLNIKLSEQSRMDIFISDYFSQKNTNIELDNSAFLQYEKGYATNITNVKLVNQSLLAGTYNISNLEANDSVFGIGATKNTYIGAIKADVARGSNNAFWLMGTNLDIDKNLVAINTSDSLINLPLMILKGAKANYINFISGIIVGEKGWTNSYIKDFDKYIKIYDVSNNGGDVYTIYKLNVDDSIGYAGGDFSVDANGDLQFNNAVYENVTNNSNVITGGNIYIFDRQKNVMDVVFDADFNTGEFKNKLQYTPLIMPTFNKIKPEVIKVASDYAKFYNFAIRNDNFTNTHKVNKDGVWLDARANFANNAIKNILKIGAGRLKENHQSDYYLGAFAEFSQSNLNKIGAKIKKFGAGIYGGWLFLNGAFVNYDAKIFNIKNHINNDILNELNGNKIGFNLNYELGYLFNFNNFLITPSIQQFITFSPNFMLLNADGKIDIEQKILFSNKLNTSLEYSFNEYLDLALNFGYAFDLNSGPDFMISSNGDKVRLEKDKKWNYFYAKFKSRANINEKVMVDFEYGKDFGKKYQSGHTFGATFKYIF